MWVCTCVYIGCDWRVSVSPKRDCSPTPEIPKRDGYIHTYIHTYKLFLRFDAELVASR